MTLRSTAAHAAAFIAIAAPGTGCTVYPAAPPPQHVWALPVSRVTQVEPAPFPDVGAAWCGGYRVREGNRVWAAGHWMARPQPNCAWGPPGDEHRDACVVFVTGCWSPPGVAFAPPPPGSRVHLFVPAPIGTAAAVVARAAAMAAASAATAFAPNQSCTPL